MVVDIEKKIQLAVEHSFVQTDGVQEGSVQKGSVQETDFSLAIKVKLPSKGITAIYGPSG